MHRVPIYVTYTWPTGAQFSFFTLSRAPRSLWDSRKFDIYTEPYREYITEDRENEKRRSRPPASTPRKVYRVPVRHGEKGVESWTRDRRCGRGLVVPTSLSLVPSFSEKLRYIWFTVGIVRAFETRDSDPRFSNRPCRPMKASLPLSSLARLSPFVSNFNS